MIITCVKLTLNCLAQAGMLEVCFPETHLVECLVSKIFHIWQVFSVWCVCRRNICVGISVYMCTYIHIHRSDSIHIRVCMSVYVCVVWGVYLYEVWVEVRRWGHLEEGKRYHQVDGVLPIRLSSSTFKKFYSYSIFLQVTGFKVHMSLQTWSQELSLVM